MAVSKSIGVVAAATMIVMGSAGAAQAFNPVAVVGQAAGTLSSTISSGSADTVSSALTDPAAHAYLAGNPGSRYIVVLGARINPDGTLPGILNARLDKAASIARVQPGSRIIVSGGPTQPLPYNEAQAMLAGLVLRGINPNNVILEGRSYSTVDNARNTAVILNQNGAQGAVLVTSASHIDRAMGSFISAAPHLTFVPVVAQGW